MFTLLFLAMGTFSTSAQSPQKIYSNLDNAASISVTQNHIYIVEQGKNRLLKLDYSGKLLETIGGRGSGDYEFSKPVDVDATNGLKIFVTDYNNRRVQVFDRRAQYLSSIEGRTSFGNSRRYNPTQIAVSGLGEVYFADDESRLIHHFDLDYNLLDEFRIPGQIKSVDELIVREGEINILDRTSETIHRLALNGAYNGFYPAENVLSIFAQDSGIWMVYKDKVIYEPKTGEGYTLNLETIIPAVDVHVEREGIFILTKTALFKLPAPPR
jgi:hypothetical protein